MDLKAITLENLLNNPLILHVELNGEYYFSKNILNALYEDNFQYVRFCKINIPEGNFRNLVDFISWTEISAHVEHNKNLPDFGELIDKAFKKK